MAKTMGQEMANTIRLFSLYFGPYPYKHLAVTSLPISYSYGQGWPGLIYLWSGSFLDATQRHEIGLPEAFNSPIFSEPTKAPTSGGATVWGGKAITISGFRRVLPTSLGFCTCSMVKT